MFVFFFQAEDGIRDFHVTGVQTCALPISRGARSARRGVHCVHFAPGSWPCGRAKPRARSEERRVGKECRSRWWPKHRKKNEDVFDASFYITAGDTVPITVMRGDQKM